MDILPKNQRKKDNLIKSLNEQIGSLNEKVKRIQREMAIIERKKQALSQQQDNYSSQAKVVLQQIAELNNYLAVVTELAVSPGQQTVKSHSFDS